MPRISSLAFSFAFVLAACGGAADSDLLGTPPGNGSDAGGTDGRADGQPVPDGGACGACGTAAPAGFHYVSYQADRGAACPAGATTFDVITGVGDSVTCNCPCKVAPPDCATGNLVRTSDNDPINATCGLTGTVLSAAAPTCTPFQNFQIGLSTHIKVGPPPVVGVCSAEGKPDLTSLKATLGRVCDAPADCSGIVCGGPKRCVAQAGDVACPAGFANKTLVGATVSAKCEACGACKADVQCDGTLSFFSDNACTMGQVDMPADNMCVARPVNSGGVVYHAYTYKGSVKSATCTPPPDTKGAPSLDGVTSVCCAN